MKRLLILLLILLTLTGCAAGSAMYSEDTGSSHFYGICEEYTGLRSSQLTLGENACINLQCTIDRKAGGVDIEITGGGEVYAYDGLRESAELVLQLTAPGDYTISVNADDFSGGFHFDWETVGAAAP